MAAGDIFEINSFNNHPIHEAVAPIIWLHGKWRSEDGQGSYPTISPFSYAEEIHFYSVGQPGLNYSSVSWNPEKKMPMHQEAGFLRIKPNSNNLAFMVSHNFGLTSIEEGEVADQSITLTCDKVNRMSFSKAPQVTKTKRVFTLRSDGVLEQVFYMETDSTQMTEHLRATYHKVD